MADKVYGALRPVEAVRHVGSPSKAALYLQRVKALAASVKSEPQGVKAHALASVQGRRS